MTSSPTSRLISLLLALFERDELIRLFGYEYGETLVGKIDVDQSLQAVVQSLVDRLESLGLIDERLFQILRDNRPARADLVDEIRAEMLDAGGSQADPVAVARSVEPPDEANEDMSDARREWRAMLKDSLEQLDEGPEEPATPWIEAAAVLDRFDPLTIDPVGGAEVDVPADLLAQFETVCDTRHDGLMSLGIRRRREMLAELAASGRLLEAIDAHRGPAPIHTMILRRVASGEWMDARSFGTLDELRAAVDVADWLATSDVHQFDTEQLQVALERRNHIAPLERLTGVHFRGRKKELATLDEHIEGRNDAVILAMWGVGGVGKSALVGKVLLGLEDRPGWPWVYLDYDDPDIDPLRPQKVVELINRHLARYFAGAEASGAFRALESAAAADGLAFTYDLPERAEPEEMLAIVGRFVRETCDNLGVPHRFTLVLDTFEQAQVRGHRALELTRGLLDAVSGAMPFARIVVAGRAPIPQWTDAAELPLTDLDAESADAVLEALGVADVDTRSLVIERVGTQPLSLRLVADALTSKTIDVDDVQELLVEVRRLELQGKLYTRILRQIKDGEIQRLAHPGLVVRRITVGVIEDVLAEHCRIGPGRAEDLIERLPLQVDLFQPSESTEEEGTALVHRQDVREVMLQLMLEDPAYDDVFEDIHRGALKHYAGRTDAIARAELIYHHLMLDDDPELFDELWSEDLTTSLGRAADEPMEERARRWLAARLGGTVEQLDEIRTRDWEVTAEREVAARLQTGDAAGALDVLDRRPDRTDGSSLHRLEIQALTMAGRPEEALQRVEPALESALRVNRLGEAFEIRLLAAQIATEQGAWPLATAHLDRAGRIASQLDDDVALIRVGLMRVTADRVSGDAEGDARSTAALERLVLDVDDVTLRRNESLIQSVLPVLNADSAPVLSKVATAYGNRTDQRIIEQDAFKLEDLLHTVDTETTNQLSDLASAVGLAKDTFTIKDLADNAVRFNLVGDALATVLETSGGDERVRSLAASMIRDIGGGGVPA